MNDAARTSLLSWLFGRRKSKTTSAPTPMAGGVSAAGAGPGASAAAASVPAEADASLVTAEVSVEELAFIFFDQPLAAVKAYRERTGADLKTAKAAVDAAAAEVAAGHFPAVASRAAGPASSFPPPSSQETELVVAGKPIAAIKAYRERTGADLKTAKAVMDTVSGK